MSVSWEVNCEEGSLNSEKLTSNDLHLPVKTPAIFPLRLPSSHFRERNDNLMNW